MFFFFLVKVDQQSKPSTSQAPSATAGGEPMDKTTPEDVAKVLVRTCMNKIVEPQPFTCMYTCTYTFFNKNISCKCA